MKEKQAIDCFMKQKLRALFTKIIRNTGRTKKWDWNAWGNIERTWGKHGNNSNTKGKIRFENQRFPTLNVWKGRVISFLRKKSPATSAWNPIVEQNRRWYYERIQDTGEFVTKDISYRRTAI